MFLSKREPSYRGTLPSVVVWHSTHSFIPMALRANGGCQSVSYLVFFVAVSSFCHLARSQTSSSSVKLKEHGMFSQSHSKGDGSGQHGRLIIGRSPLEGAVLNPLDVDTDYQSDGGKHYLFIYFYGSAFS